jgi:hypothetical protein
MNEIVQPTAEQVAKSYSAIKDSIDLLEAGKPEYMQDAEWQDCVKRNVEHVEIQLTKGAAYYGQLDLTSFKQAISRFK